MPTTKSGYQKYLVYLKDVIYIIGILTALYGWLSTKLKSEAKDKQTLELNTKAVENNTKAIEKVNEYLFEQNKFNGQVEEYMKTHQ